MNDTARVSVPRADLPEKIHSKFHLVVSLLLCYISANADTFPTQCRGTKACTQILLCGSWSAISRDLGIRDLLAII